MLRFIMDTGLASPADNEHDRNGINLIIQQGSHRIDDIALSGILHIDNRNLAGCQMIAGSQRRAVTLVRGDDMVLLVDAIFIHKVITKRFQLGIRNAGVKIRPYDLNKLFYLHYRTILLYICRNTSAFSATGLFFNLTGFTD